MHEEHERSKKYTPGATWKDLAEDWSNTKKPENDFQDDLRLLANQLRRGKGKNSPIGDGIPVSRSAPKDWDAPEFEEDNPEAYEVPHGIKRKRRLIAREDSVSPPPQTLKFGEENEDRWTKKSKIPRMSMYADEEEDKVSAKDRIFSSIKRRVANKPQIEVYEEDVEDEAFDEQVVEGDEQVDMRHRLNFKVHGKDDESPSGNDARSRLNERFKLSSSLKSRLGDKEHVEEQYDSGDSLENDTGADLGDTTEKMVIQVTQSDEDESKKPSKPSKSRSSHKDHQRRRKDDRNEAMEEDGEEETNNDVDHRKKSLPKDLRSKISSEVIKIKTEKGEEEKKAAARRKRENEADQRQAEAELREARRRQRSERRLDRDDQDDRRRRREQERRNNDSRVVNRPDNRELKNRKDFDRKPKSDQRKKQIKIKKEKMSDDSTSDSDSSSSSSSDSSSSSSSDSSSSDSSSDSDSSSSSSSDSSSSSSSDSSSSDSSSDSDSSSNSSGSERRKKKKSGTGSKSRSSKDDRKKSSNDKNARSDNKSQEGIRDKLQEYLAKAKERRRKGG